MGRKHKHLFGAVTDIDWLRLSFERASRGKRGSLEYLRFAEHSETNLAHIRARLLGETWAPAPPRVFTVHEPKRRLVQAPLFRDRVVHHALVDVIEPIFDATFNATVFACRKGLGTHQAMRWVRGQSQSGRWTHSLHTDFAAFFTSIDRAVLHGLIRHKISDPQVLRLIEQITPPMGTGLPIGALTSQLFANIYASQLDHYLTHELHVRWCRYMDDVVVFGESAKQLREVLHAMETFADETMSLKMSRWRLAPLSAGIDFVGYRVWPHKVLLRRRSVKRAKRRISAAFRHDDWADVASFWGSWQGHALHADSESLLAELDRRYELSASIARHHAQARRSSVSSLKEIFG